ncbi:tryptophan synthase beta subunit-like PLP-dependent enzyme [Atractiella rhizophila]|nr:tryptophan synthase beta subunit-like PLP-dependent enzyme [Atractiella rhizophila]
MEYISSRGGSERLTFEEAVLRGLASNGGLLLPSVLPPPFTAEQLNGFSTLSFPALAHTLLKLFIPSSSIEDATLLSLLEKTYAISHGKFRAPEVAPIRRISDNQWAVELWWGPTWAFKDVALQFLGNLFEFFLQRKNEGKDENSADRERLTVVGATSGDTGSAAIYGLRSKQDVAIFILHPEGKISEIQEAQMTSVLDENVFNLAVKGNFDDCQEILKSMFSDKDFNEHYHLGAVNSINWARILAQITYYFSSYFAVLKSQNIPASSLPKIDFVVPTGNFGDVLAGWFAKRLGLPIGKLVIATNENDILQRFWKTGVYEKNAAAKDQAEGATSPPSSDPNGGVKATLSPAMDILVSSNFERLLFYLARDRLCSGDNEKAGEYVRCWMEDLKTTGRFEVPKEVWTAAQEDFCAERVSDEQTKETIRNYFKPRLQTYGSYVVDPHTAVGLTAANRVKSSSTQLILSTAHPAKFSAAVSAALEDETEFEFDRDVMPAELKGLLQKERRMVKVKDRRETMDVVGREVKVLWGI